MLLSGLKVVEMSTWIAAPGCAMIMAEWGAEVVKVESPDGGDAIRRFYPDTPESPGNPIFSMENRGKRGIVLDVYSDEGRAALIALDQMDGGGLTRQLVVPLVGTRDPALQTAVFSVIACSSRTQPSAGGTGSGAGAGVTWSAHGG